MKKVHQIKVSKDMDVDSLVREMDKAGVMGGGKLALGVEILERMIKDKECKVFLGQAGAMVPGGMKNIFVDMLKNKWIDVFVCTGATLTHDMIEALGFNHYQGDELDDDVELNKKGYDRIYNSLMPNDVYGKLEDFFKEHFDSFKDLRTVREFLWELGKILDNDESILTTCYKEKIPIFCPTIADSGIGLMIWGQMINGREIKAGAFDDLKDILDFAWTARKAGVFYVGGGVPKNYIQQAMQFAPGAAAYGVQLTTDRPEPGGSSGAPLKEGISWGKMGARADFVDVICDATIALPFMYAALKSRL
tara:strand:- start:340 stop:1257 length:918 start_codon:yes stop_codon:yes gene_type:complete